MRTIPVRKDGILILLILLISIFSSDAQVNNSVMGKTWIIFIENSKYETFASLDGPTQDVVLMKAALMNYKIDKIIHKKDLTKKQMEDFISYELKDQIIANKVNSVLFWYAGHGKFIYETGYWVPVDARRDDESTYFNTAFLKKSLQSYQNELTHILVITDACESGPTFYQAMRATNEIKNCSDLQASQSKSSQVFSSSGYDLAIDESQFTRAFANSLTKNSTTCIPIEAIVAEVTSAVVRNNQQKPKFGKIEGLKDEDGTFFFISK